MVDGTSEELRHEPSPVQQRYFPSGVRAHFIFVVLGGLLTLASLYIWGRGDETLASPLNAPDPPAEIMPPVAPITPTPTLESGTLNSGEVGAIGNQAVISLLAPPSSTQSGDSREASSEMQPPAPSVPLFDITDQAVQSPYQDGVPFLDQDGHPRIVIVPGSFPLAGDWNGSGRCAPGVFLPTPTPRFLLAGDRKGHATTMVDFGGPGDLPMVGDWSGTGTADIGVYHPSTSSFSLRHGEQIKEIVVPWAEAGDLPVAGRWRKGLPSSVGLFRPNTGTFLLVSDVNSGTADPWVLTLPTQPGDLPVAGDWFGTGVAQPSVYRSAAGQLIIAGAGGQVVVQQVAPAGTGGMPLACNWDSTGSDRLTLVRIGPPPNFWIADGSAEGSLQAVDTMDLNQSFFPLGLYHLDDVRNFPIVKNAGFNSVLVWPNVNPRTAAQAAVDSGLKLVIHAIMADRFPDVQPWGIYLADEPYGGTIADGLNPDDMLLRLRQQYARMRSRAPILFFTETANGLRDRRGSPSVWADFLRVGNVGAIDDYLKAQRNKPLNLAAIAQSVQAMVGALGDSRPAWFVPQAHAYTTRMLQPTSEEERAMVYTALVHGATGIYYFAWDSFVSRAGDVVGIRPDPLPVYPGNGYAADPETLAGSRNLWEGLDASHGGLNAELAELRPVLMAPTSSLRYHVEASLPAATPSVRTLLKQLNRRVWLLAVNLAASPVQSRVIFATPVAQVHSRMGPEATLTSAGNSEVSFALQGGDVILVEAQLASPAG